MLVLLCIAVPWAILLVALVVTVGVTIRLKVVRVLKEAMKLNLMSRSPVATILGASISGLPTIRAYNQEKHFQTSF